jgi:hypothetical protein
MMVVATIVVLFLIVLALVFFLLSVAWQRAREGGTAGTPPAERDRPVTVDSEDLPPPA